MIKEITIEEFLVHEELVAVDVRSPSEYDGDTIPGAINVPLLDDSDRQRVGTVYHTEGPVQARLLGLELVSPRLPGIIKEVERAAGERPVMVFCWRGGLRSQAVAQVLSLMGIPAFRLTGGYKSFRQHVNGFFSRQSLPQPFTVLSGLTGVGKTEIIRHLRQQGVAAIDLEELASHRGSVFGHIGLGHQPSQKSFETRLFRLLNRFKEASTLVVECESRRIGKLFLPDLVVQGIKNGKRVLVFDTLSNRVERILKEYAGSPNSNIAALDAALQGLKKRLGTARLQELSASLAAGDLKKVVTSLLLDYYDPLYGYPGAPVEGYDLCVDSSQTERAAEEIKAFLEAS
ncbi:hypothetical protein SY88_00720 [Clostridiales bacterium PH28_bin88]|nr:hypothetical protein SY88_00720 [Clostridiales bacterium PH28_bin88]